MRGRIVVTLRTNNIHRFFFSPASLIRCKSIFQCPFERDNAGHSGASPGSRDIAISRVRHLSRSREKSASGNRRHLSFLRVTGNESRCGEVLIEDHHR
ncbi:hypothetical protein AVEN_134023-1 [Araneus ventricosus]|uniref:Uncharacterized protein n=1 Tax=Araneus ventricosus TaxID=182803 RepID=A0A4Y2K4L4_ARAVE|nr:hypothetical protein AVEN_134023-1 [Araneus ventricosus]